MREWLITLGLMSSLSCVYFGILLFYKKYSLLALSFIVFGLGFWFNPDLMDWYQYLKENEQVQQARKILENPEKFKVLVDKLEARVHAVPQDAKAWFLLGRLKAGQGDWKGAHDALFQAYRIHPNEIKTAIFYVETILNTQGQLNVFARQILNQVLTQDPNQADALMLLGADAKQHQCFAVAAKYWQKVLPQVPKDEKMYESLKLAIEKSLNQSNQACDLK